MSTEHKQEARMPVLDLFSKRHPTHPPDDRDVYDYSGLPDTLRVQILQIARATIGHHRTSPNGATVGHDSMAIYAELVASLRRERGVMRLPPSTAPEDPWDELSSHFLDCARVEEALDVVELLFSKIHWLGKHPVWDYYSRMNGSTQTPQQAIDELNARFLEHRVGYQFELGRILPATDSYIHETVTRPALEFLAAPQFRTPMEEFLRAHDQYCHKNYAECLVDCNKSFESTMLVIATERGWALKGNESSQSLIDLCVKNDLAPRILCGEFSALRTLLGAGVPPLRNRLAGHGQGVRKTPVTREIAAFALAVTAANIALLVALHEKSHPPVQASGL